MRFEQLYSLITEANDFSDLPDEKPYGFWVSPQGQYYVVGPYLHAEEAENLVNNSPTLHAEYLRHKDEIHTNAHEEDFLYYKKYCKTVIEGRYMHYRNPIFDVSQYPKIKQTLKDIAAFYNLEIY